MTDNENHEIIGDEIVLKFAIAVHEFIAGLADEPRAWFAKELESPALIKISPRGGQWLRNAIDGDNPGPVNLYHWSGGDIAQASLMSLALFTAWGDHQAVEPGRLAFLMVCMFNREAALRLQERHEAAYN